MKNIPVKNGDSGIWSFIKREYWLISIVVGVVLAVYIPMSSIQRDIAIINTNHEAHIQDIYAELQRLSNQQDLANEERKELLKAVIENQTLIKTHMDIK